MTDLSVIDSQIKFVNDDGILTDIAFLFLNRLWARSGEFTGDITAITEDSAQDFFWDTPSIASQVQLLSTATNVTTDGNLIIIATSNIIVTLNPNPVDNEKVTVKRATSAGSVTISASAIDGSTTYSMIVNYEAAQCIYSATDSEWFIV